MKKFIALLLALLLTLSALPALAEGADIRMELPQEIHSFFSASSFKGYTLYPDSFTVLQNGAGGQVAFAVLSKGSEHIFYGFEMKNNKWQYWLKNASLLPQIKGQYQLSNAKGSTDFHANLVYTEDALSIALLEEDLDYFRYGSLFVSTEKGQWMLVSLSTYLLNSRHYTSARVYADHIAYYSETAFLGHAWGVVETNLRYVNFSAFPGTLEEARNVLSTPPDIPSGSALSATDIHFTGGQKYAVYSGPGREYERAANGKATVSTNDWIQVFGQEGDYILIQYDISSDQMRFGYIPVASLPKNTSVSPLSLESADAVILQNTYLTDDPLKSRGTVRTLQTGESGVKWLASMGVWTYVEIAGNGKPVRGFVPASAISVLPKEQILTAAYTGSEYTAQATLELSSPSITASVTVTAPGSWENNAEKMIHRYQLYANHLPVNASLYAQDLSAQDGYFRGFFVRAFTLSAALPAGTTLIGLCPVYQDGSRAEETIIIPLE